MILVGELEYTDRMMAPDGYRGFLWVSEYEGYYYYNISPYPEDKAKWLGDNFKTSNQLSVTEFLQRVVDMDLSIGRGVIKKFPDTVGIRLKGMKDWITRKPLANE